MKQIYLIQGYKVDENGCYKKGNKSKIYSVYTSRRLANKAIDYLNEEWREAFTTKDFKKIWWYAITILPISKLDYSKLTF